MGTLSYVRHVYDLTNRWPAIMRIILRMTFPDCGWAAMVEIWGDQEARSMGMKGSTVG